MALIIEWDPEKAHANLKKHRVSFEEASTAFGDPVPHFNFDFLHAQNGILTYYADGYNRFLAHGHWFSLEQVLHEYRENLGERIPLKMIILPAALAREVIWHLFKQGKTAAHLRPTYEYVAKAVEQKWELESDTMGQLL